MKTVSEVSRLAHISVRALHHYDAIGLLKPTEVTEAGYRLYDDEALKRLNAIMLFRELDFSLSEIKQILDSDGFDYEAALKSQIELLEARRERLDSVIGLAREILEKGDGSMNFDAFDRSNEEALAAEAKKRWGGTKEHAESERREAGRGEDEKQALSDEMMAFFARFGKVKNGDPAGEEAQSLAAGLRDFISANYYDCGKEMFRCLGAMYTDDERFRSNIDAAGGEGTAAFARRAIEIFCGK